MGWGMQMSTATLQPGVSEVSGSMYPANAMEVVTQQCGGPIHFSTDAADSQNAINKTTTQSFQDAAIPEEDSPSSAVRRHRRSRRGGAARKKLQNSDETQEFTSNVSVSSLAVPEPKRGARIRCWADADPDAESDDGLASFEAKAQIQVDEHSSDITADSETTVLSPASFEESSSITESMIDPLLLELDAVEDERRQ